MAKDNIKVQMCVTSPPYYGLRDYGADGQIGLEEDPKKETTKLNTGSVFVCDGKTLRQFLNCAGYGLYNMINITLYDHKRSGYQDDNDSD